METFVDIISHIGAQISKIKRCRINQQTLSNTASERIENNLCALFCKEQNFMSKDTKTGQRATRQRTHSLKLSWKGTM